MIDVEKPGIRIIADAKAQARDKEIVDGRRDHVSALYISNRTFHRSPGNNRTSRSPRRASTTARGSFGRKSPKNSSLGSSRRAPASSDSRAAGVTPFEPCFASATDRAVG